MLPTLLDRYTPHPVPRTANLLHLYSRVRDDGRCLHTYTHAHACTHKPPYTHTHTLTLKLTHNLAHSHHANLLVGTNKLIRSIFVSVCYVWLQSPHVPAGIAFISLISIYNNETVKIIIIVILYSLIFI